ncbi:hypothetical protein CIPAW_03G095100 [Carya illinoinensis]|uniref:Retrotransposon gag domain-containing protein n=1 Tax=Carya illinoinensis TaxID=32201 RepID=A0A8T1R0Q9_CARIL|nr:hypothetical protein CIPAW_03G095100 [Carya illinoinensis]
MSLNATNRAVEESRRDIETLKRETNVSLERLERRMVETNGQRPPPSPNRQGHEVLVDGAETSVTGSLRELPQNEFRRGGRIENNRVVVERWIPNIDQPTRTHKNRDYHERGYGVDHHKDRRGNWANDRRPKRPNVDFPKFNDGDPYEWLDKVDHYFHTYKVPRRERVSTAYFYLEGKASKWWRWIRDQYEKDMRILGWTAFEKKFLMQFGSSPTINHHGQLAKLRQEGKVHSYIEEFRQLQTLVRGWSEEALVGAFVDGLKPWIAKDVKLKQPSKIQEAMRIAEILEESTNMEKRQSKKMGSKVTTPLQTNVPWKCKEEMESASKSKPLEMKKLSREDVQDKIKKGLCFKCGEK